MEKLAMKKEKEPKQTILGETYFHINNGGISFLIIDEEECSSGGGPILRINGSFFGVAFSWDIPTDRYSLVSFAKMIITSLDELNSDDNEQSRCGAYVEKLRFKCPKCGSKKTRSIINKFNDVSDKDCIINYKCRECKTEWYTDKDLNTKYMES